MKISMMVAFAAMAALCMTGCKYDKLAGGAGSVEDPAKGSEIGADEPVAGLVSGISEGKFEDMYQRCTDVNFASVYFGFDSTVVPQGELGKIDEVAKHLADNPSRVVVVEGNCDERGSNEYNMSLGENRAQIIRNYLVQSGIGDNRIQTRSYGEDKPADPGHDESAWAKNRRGEFVIFDSSKKL